jgi:hypothetical protein
MDLHPVARRLVRYQHTLLPISGLRLRVSKSGPALYNSRKTGPFRRI